MIGDTLPAERLSLARPGTSFVEHAGPPHQIYSIEVSDLAG